MEPHQNHFDMQKGFQRLFSLHGEMIQGDTFSVGFSLIDLFTVNISITKNIIPAGMVGGVTVVTEGVTTAATDGLTVMMDPLLEMIAGKSRYVTTVGTVIGEENEEEDLEDQDGKKIL